MADQIPLACPSCHQPMEPGYTGTGWMVQRKSRKYRPVWWPPAKADVVVVPMIGSGMEYFPSQVCQKCKLFLLSYEKSAYYGTSG